VTSVRVATTQALAVAFAIEIAASDERPLNQRVALERPDCDANVMSQSRPGHSRRISLSVAGGQKHRSYLGRSPMSCLRFTPAFAALSVLAGTALAAPATSTTAAPATAKPAKPAMARAKPAMRAAPRRMASAPAGRMVTTKTSTGKTITYNCSLAGNATKAACK
jgi:hypothetical protein